MTKTSNKDENILTVLKRLSKRVEETAVDIHEMKHTLKSVDTRLDTMDTRLHTVESNTEATRKNVEDLMETTAEILVKMVTQGEHESLSQRITKIEKAQRLA